MSCTCSQAVHALHYTPAPQLHYLLLHILHLLLQPKYWCCSLAIAVATQVQVLLTGHCKPAMPVIITLLRYLLLSGKEGGSQRQSRDAKRRHKHAWGAEALRQQTAGRRRTHDEMYAVITCSGANLQFSTQGTLCLLKLRTILIHFQLKPQCFPWPQALQIR